MKTIRSKMFETNSSSSHVVSVCGLTPSHLLDTSMSCRESIFNLYPNNEDVNIDCTLSGAREKLDYLLAHVGVNSSYHNADTTEARYDVIKQVVEDMLKCKVVIHPYNKGEGYGIEGDGIGDDFYCYDTVKAFIFNKNSFVKYEYN